MIAVMFEAEVEPEQQAEYLRIAAGLRPLLDDIDGFISVERFQSLSTPGKLLSLSFWRDEEALQTWRNLEPHRAAQLLGRSEIFADYRLRIGEVDRDYSKHDRAEAPADSSAYHGAIKGRP
jgi:heme-degrading monooxygenase HmoA